MSDTRAYGYSDLPLGPDGTDGLGIRHYYEGLATFIRRCHTPMTIAVQGDWGSGKTSAMNLIQGYLPDEEVKRVSFNTWQYSQLGMGDDLVLSLMQELISVIAPESSELRQRFAKIAWAASASLMRQVSAMVGFADVGKDTVAAAEAAFAQKASLASSLKSLRDEFESEVESFCQNHHKNRVVVFIDDLDRLEPVRAVEVMECLKVFFDCARCVFVVAVDFDVVMHGVHAKYGGEMTTKKARSFFDKIIQVPFVLPTGTYEVDSFLRGEINRSGAPVEAGEIEVFVELAKLSVGTNPRSLKRLLNTYELIRIILRQDAGRPERDRVLFALLCAQAAYPMFYADLIRHAVLPTQLGEIFSAEPDSEDGGFAAWGIDVEDAQVFESYLKFVEKLLRPADGEPVDTSLLQESLRIASVTSVGTNAVNTSREEDLVWSAHQIIARASGSLSTSSKKLFEMWMKRLPEVLGAGRPVTMSGQQNPAVSLYRSGNLKFVQEQQKRSRPKFAEVGYGRSALLVRFGDRKGWRSPGDAGYGDQWEDVVTRARKLFPAADGMPAFKVREQGLPFQISQIRTADQLEAALSLLPDAYDISGGSVIG